MVKDDAGTAGINPITITPLAANDRNPASAGDSIDGGAAGALVSITKAFGTMTLRTDGFGTWEILTAKTTKRVPIVPVVGPTFSAQYSDLILGDTSGGNGALDVLLPTDASPGETITIKDFGGNATAVNITITPLAADSIDQGAVGVPITIAADNASVTLCSSGVGQWSIID